MEPSRWPVLAAALAALLSGACSSRPGTAPSPGAGGSGGDGGSGGPTCQPQTEVCNQEDDDCDGDVDEDQGTITCGVGICERTLSACRRCEPGIPAREACGSGLDEDCDGLTDCADPDCKGRRVILEDVGVVLAAAGLEDGRFGVVFRNQDDPQTALFAAFESDGTQLSEAELQGAPGGDDYQLVAAGPSFVLTATKGLGSSFLVYDIDDPAQPPEPDVVGGITEVKGQRAYRALPVSGRGYVITGVAWPDPDVWLTKKTHLDEVTRWVRVDAPGTVSVGESAEWAFLAEGTRTPFRVSWQRLDADFQLQGEPVELGTDSEGYVPWARTGEGDLVVALRLGDTDEVELVRMSAAGEILERRQELAPMASLAPLHGAFALTYYELSPGEFRQRVRVAETGLELGEPLDVLEQFRPESIHALLRGSDGIVREVTWSPNTVLLSGDADCR